MSTKSYNPPSGDDALFMFELIRRAVYGDADDTDAYSIDDKEGSALHRSMPAPRVARLSSVGRSNKSLTYGEVIPSSIDRDVLPALGLREGDVFLDLGSGTGLIPMQAAVTMPHLAAAKGIEFATGRHNVAAQAYRQLSSLTATQVCARTGVDIHTGERAAALARHIAPKLSAIHGSFLDIDFSDATVVWINNTVFEPSLMLALLSRLCCTHMRRVCVIRPLCARHSLRCVTREDPCCAFMHPAEESYANPTWCDRVKIYTYTKLPAGSSPEASLPYYRALPMEPSISLRAPPRVSRVRVRPMAMGGAAPAIDDGHEAAGTDTTRASAPQSSQPSESLVSPPRRRVKAASSVSVVSTPARRRVAQPGADEAQPSTASRRVNPSAVVALSSETAVPSPQRPRVSSKVAGASPDTRLAAPHSVKAAGHVPGSPQRKLRHGRNVARSRSRALGDSPAVRV